jgi:hypothetical protein
MEYEDRREKTTIALTATGSSEEHVTIRREVALEDLPESERQAICWVFWQGIIDILYPGSEGIFGRPMAPRTCLERPPAH